MFFTYVLASAWAMSAVVGRSSDPTSRQMAYEKEDKTTMKSHETSQLMAIGDRSSNLKYVMVIQGSMIWEEIKKQSLKVQGIYGMDTEKSPDKLTDGELAQLKQACHDGLKCVAANQLLVLLKQIKEPLIDDIVSVRRAIAKITQVLTQYTTEYHEDVYQYEVVQQSDDQTKVYETVTTIVEDNKELCQIDLKPTTKQSHPKTVDRNTIPAVVNNNSAVNYNTTENYNINNGTINSATINKEPSDLITVVESPEPGTQANKDSDPRLVIVIAPQPEIGDIDGYTKKRSVDDHLPSKRTTTTGTDTNGLNGDKSVTKAAKNDVSHKRARQNHARGSGTSDQHYESGTTDDHPHKYARSANEKLASVGEQLTINEGPSPHEGVGTDKDVQPQKARRLRPDTTGRTSHKSVDVDKKNVSPRHRSADTKANTHDPGHSDHAENNNVNLKNRGENDKNSQSCKCNCDLDIVSAGSLNEGTVRKGLVEDGTLNNGNMVQYNINNGTINKGTISESNENNGIISVGTVNNGPVNYGTSEVYVNNENQNAMDSYDVQQYLLDIDKVYSTILDRLG
ncbi:hypothetical protein QTP88_013619 [Uroleucon formosanum]